MSDKNEICVVFLFEIPADEFFLLRLQIEGVTDFAVVFLCHQLFGLTEFYKGDLICFRKGDIQDLKLRGVVFFQKLHRVLEKTGLHLADFHEILDVAHLKIQAGVLVQMSFWCCASPHGKPDRSQRRDRKRPPSSVCKTAGSGPERPVCGNS